MGENVSYTYMHINHVAELMPGDTYEAFVRRVEAKYTRPPGVVVELAQAEPQAVPAIPPVEPEGTPKAAAGLADAALPALGEVTAGEDAPVAEPPASNDEAGRRRPGRPRKT